MVNVTVIGAQWGDEGKGKIVDALSEEIHAVCRFQGGHNAGHTLVIDKKVFKLRGELVICSPGTLPKDGLVIEDKRSYD